MVQVSFQILGVFFVCLFPLLDDEPNLVQARFVLENLVPALTFLTRSSWLNGTMTAGNRSNIWLTCDGSFIPFYCREGNR